MDASDCPEEIRDLVSDVWVEIGDRTRVWLNWRGCPMAADLIDPS